MTYRSPLIILALAGLLGGCSTVGLPSASDIIGAADKQAAPIIADGAEALCDNVPLARRSAVIADAQSILVARGRVIALPNPSIGTGVDCDGDANTPQ